MAVATHTHSRADSWALGRGDAVGLTTYSAHLLHEPGS